MRKFLSVFLLLCLLLSVMSGTALMARSYDPMLKIGLYYDSSALAAANLQNVSGMDIGYSFGYFDSDREFVPVYEIDDENQITVLKNDTMWRSGSTYTDERPASYDDVIGAYCLQIDDLFDAEDASDICYELRREYDLNAYLCSVRDGFRVRIGTYETRDEAEERMERLQEKIDYDLVSRGPSSTCCTVVVTGTSEILFQQDLLGDAPLGIWPFSEQTWFKGYKYYGGFEYFRAGGNNINVINVVGITDYVKGVIPYEMSPSWPLEALKAQALCAKSYSLNNLNKHRAKGFDLCNTTDCQVYYGTNKSTDYSDSAVEDTEGLFVMYDGQVCQTYYHASSGGYTEDVENIWGKDIPYLKAVEDTYLTSFRPFSHTLDLDDISWILQTKGLVTQDVTDLYVSKYSAVGNVIGLTVELADGTSKTFTGDRSRTALNSQTLGITIGSHRYTINGGTSESTININGAKITLDDLYAQGDGKRPKKVDADDGLIAMTASGLKEVTVTEPEKNESKDGVYVITGTGSGHNIGLSQEGARAMAEQGFTCDEIIEFYFTGATVDYYDPN